MVSYADRHAFLIEHAAHVVGVYAGELEGDHGRLLTGRADQAQTRDGREGGAGMREQILLGRVHPLHAERLEVVDGRGQPDGPRDVGGAYKAPMPLGPKSLWPEKT